MGLRRRALIREFRDDGTLSSNGQPNDADDYLDAYAYDLNGNRWSKSHVFCLGTANRTQTTAYEYDLGGDDRPTGETTTEPSQPTSVTTYAYDDNGSQTEKRVSVGGSLQSDQKYE